MIPDILEPKTSALIDDLTPLPDVPHNLIRPHGDIYVELEKHGLLSHEQAYRMRRRFDDYDSAACGTLSAEACGLARFRNDRLRDISQ